MQIPPPPDSLFGNMSVGEFLSEYWQKKPLLVRGAWPDFRSPVPPKEFLRTTVQPNVSSRLIMQREETDKLMLAEGPFEWGQLQELPGDRWTMLIQEMDQLFPEVRRMTEVLSFLPNWRLDDIMVSLAAPGGGVGAHIDQYDVFLLQGLGRRRWQIGSEPVHEEVLADNQDVRVLSDFSADQEWVLEPGDMLYLPPRFAHCGTALNECMTYSIGCRAPSKVQIVSALLEQVIEETDPEERYTDPDHRPGDHPGLLGTAILEWAKTAVSDVLEDRKWLAVTLGSILSEPRRPRNGTESGSWTAQTLSLAVRDGAMVRPVSISQGLFTETNQGTLLFFLSGDVYEVDTAMESALRALTSHSGLTAEHVDAGVVPDEAWPFLARLATDGLLDVSSSEKAAP